MAHYNDDLANAYVLMKTPKAETISESKIEESADESSFTDRGSWEKAVDKHHPNAEIKYGDWENHPQVPGEQRKLHKAYVGGEEVGHFDEIRGDNFGIVKHKKIEESVSVITPESLGFKKNKNIDVYNGIRNEKAEALETKLVAQGFTKEQAGGAHSEYESKYSHPSNPGFNIHIHSRFGSSGLPYAWIQPTNINEELA